MARYYGLETEQGGLLSCPVPSHEDKTPSMKLYEKQDDYDNFHCFGCGAHGDVIDFTGILFNLSPMEAANKLAGDFGITASPKRGKPSIVKRIEQHKSNSQESRARKLLFAYRGYLEQCQKDYMPKSPDEKLHPLFCKSLSELGRIGYLTEIITFGTQEEKKLFLQQYSGLLSQIEKELNAEPKNKTATRDYSDDR